MQKALYWAALQDSWNRREADEGAKFACKGKFRATKLLVWVGVGFYRCIKDLSGSLIIQGKRSIVDLQYAEGCGDHRETRRGFWAKQLWSTKSPSPVRGRESVVWLGNFMVKLCDIAFL